MRDSSTHGKCRSRTRWRVDSTSESPGYDQESFNGKEPRSESVAFGAAMLAAILTGEGPSQVLDLLLLAGLHACWQVADTAATT